MDLNKWQIQLRKGMLDIVILNLLKAESRHGYDMVQQLKTGQWHDHSRGQYLSGAGPVCRRMDWWTASPNLRATDRRDDIFF